MYVSLSLFLLFDAFFFCLMRVSSVFTFTVVKRKLNWQPMSKLEADLFIFRNRSWTLHCSVGRSLIILNNRYKKRQIFQLRTTAKIRHWKEYIQNIEGQRHVATTEIRRRVWLIKWLSLETVLGSNPAVAAALSPWTRLFTPIVPRRSLHISFD